MVWTKLGDKYVYVQYVCMYIYALYCILLFFQQLVHIGAALQEMFTLV